MLVGAFNQEEALVGAFSVVTNLRVDFCLKLYHTGIRYCGYRMTTVCGVAGVSVPSPQVRPVSRQHWPLVTGTLAVTCLVRAGWGGAGGGVTQCRGAEGHRDPFHPGKLLPVLGSVTWTLAP